MPNEQLVVLSTFPDPETARRIARELVTDKFAACANLLSAIESIYRWQEKLEQTPEVLVLFKTTAERYPALEAKLKALHPYDVPEIVAVPIRAGFDGYLRWVGENCA